MAHTFRHHLLPKRVTMIKRTSPYLLYGLRLLIVDRGVLLTDFFIATGVAFFIQFLVWNTIYSGDQEIQNFSFRELMFYCALSIFFARLHNCHDLIDEMAHEIIEGKLEVLMTRPCHLLLQKFFSYLGGGIPYLIPPLFLVIIFWQQNNWSAFSSAGDIGIYIATVLAFLLLGLLLSFCIGILLALSVFWLMQADFILIGLTTVMAFLGGAILPPAFWPEFIRPLMEYNPFQCFIAAPAQFMIHADYVSGLQALGLCLLYILTLLAALNLIWDCALKRYSGAGG